jgi:hypothetical protein
MTCVGGRQQRGGSRGHCRSDAKFARFVARRSHYTALGRIADRDRPPAETRIVPLLDGRVESVHIDMDDLSQSRLLYWRMHASRTGTDWERR